MGTDTLPWTNSNRLSITAQAHGARSLSNIAQLAPRRGIIDAELPSDHAHHGAGNRRVAAFACDGPDSVHQPTQRRCNAVGHRAQFLDGQALHAGERSDKFAKCQFLLIGDEEGVTTLPALQGALNSFEDIVDVAGVKGIVTTVYEGELPGVDCLGQRPAEWVAGPPD